MKRFFLLIFLIIPFLGEAQAPDYDQIEKAIYNQSSPFYYPDLFARYQNGDETLTAEDYRYLYYGYSFSPDYDPFNSSAQADSVVMLFEKNPDPGADEIKRLLKYCDEIMETDPFNPRNINLMTYAYGMLGDEEKERKSAYRFSMLMEAILSSATAPLREIRGTCSISAIRRM